MKYNQFKTIGQETVLLMSTNFHVGDFGKLGCLAMGDENKDASEFRATK